tara:strand:- start:4602 stop:5207 length:606 start_codon:yes stop_codon:yes gene_type:complete
MMHFNLNDEKLWGVFKTLSRPRSQVKRGVLHWASGGPDAKLGMAVDPWLDLLVAVNKPRGTGYSAVVGGDTLYLTSPWTAVTQHCGGSDWGNTESYGVSILYPGPSRKPRGLAGETLGPHSSLGKAWYPEIPEGQILLAAWAFRCIKKEAGLEEVKGHWEINGKKNDPRPIDMDFFRRLVFDDVFWEEQLLKIMPTPARVI